MHVLAPLDIVVIVAYFVAILSIGLFYSLRSRDTSEDYFLAGRNMGWIVIGFSLFATNIGSEHFVGLAGSGAARGLAVGNFEWIAILFLIALGWIIAPKFLTSGVYTTPEFFGRRFNNATRLYLAGISIVAYVLTKLSITLFAGGLLLEKVLGWDMYTSAIIIMVCTGIYTIGGGLRAVMYTASVQAIIMIAGSLLVTILGLIELGGWAGLQSRFPSEYFSAIKPASDPDFPWTGILFGAPILAIWYWCTDQYIVQRLMSARNINAAKNGALLAGFLKILPVLLWVVPGMIAVALFPGISGDEAYPTLIASSLLPMGIKGLVLAAVLAAIMSTLSACLNSAATLFTMDFYRYFSPDASERKQILVGRLATTVMVLIGILWIPLMKFLSSNLYVYLQSIQSFISPPITAVFLIGLFWKRATARAAIWTLVVGGAIGLSRVVFTIFDIAPITSDSIFGQLLEMNFLHFAVVLFVISSLMMIVISLLEPVHGRREDHEAYTISIRSFTANLARSNFAAERSTPPNSAWLLTAVLLVLLVGIWSSFA